MNKFGFLFSCIIGLYILSGKNMYGQNNPGTDITLAKQYLEQKEYDKAIPILKKAYEFAPFDKNAYDNYLGALMAGQKYTDAEQLVRYMSGIRREDPAMMVDLGRVLELSGQKKKAEEQYEAALLKISGDDFRTRQLADAFIHIQKEKYAIAAYERARQLVQNPYVYATELALLYGKEGKTEDAVKAMLDILVMQPHVLDDVKTSLLQVTGEDPKKISLVQKQINKRVTLQPDNPVWGELTTWVYTQQGDYTGAYNNIVSLDKKLEEEGQRVIQFSRSALKEEQYDIALKGYEYVLAKGGSSPFNQSAREGKIEVLQSRVKKSRPIDARLLERLLKEYDEYFSVYPQQKTSPFIRDYAMVRARYAHNTDTAITLLEAAIELPNMRKDQIGLCKLDLGDYYLLQGKIWDASLIYSQVDKAFKEDALGEEARFRNAKLAYYRGDFKWAQGQLSVLKASTSELIANDALALSVLITENIPADSNLTPLLWFAAADLLLFQNKTGESDVLLDSIATAFPESELLDDICLLRAKIAEEEGRYMDAVTFLEKILADYGQDVLGDDAAFRLAQLYDEILNDRQKALQYYELLITDYPGSTYIQTARSRYQKLTREKGKTS